MTTITPPTVATPSPLPLSPGERGRGEGADQGLNGSPSPKAQPVSASDRTLLSLLLRMADTYRAMNSLQQAMAIYFDLVREHGETPEGQEAQARLLQIAEAFEKAGRVRQARAVYERLLAGVQ